MKLTLKKTGPCFDSIVLFGMARWIAEIDLEMERRRTAIETNSLSLLLVLLPNICATSRATPIIPREKLRCDCRKKGRNKNWE